jgi:PEGA domain
MTDEIPVSIYKYKDGFFLIMRILIPLFLIILILLLSTGPVAGQTVNGYYRVESNPSDAQVLVDTVYRGNTPVTVAVSTTGPPSHTIIIVKSGYYPWSRTFDTNPAPGEVIGVAAVLEPSLQYGTLVVSSSPTGALVTVDGGRGQMAPWTYTDMPAGGHIVRAFLSGYQTYVSLTNVPPGGTAAVEATLLPLTDVGVIQAKSNPGGADVYIDGLYSGATSATVGNLAVGPHFVELRRAGYNPWIDTVQVLSGQVVTIDATLEVASSVETGSISVSSTPSGASVYLDGGYQGTTQPGNPLDLPGIPPGQHTVRLTLAGYQDYTQNVQVQSGGIAIVEATMTPSSSPSSAGTLQVNSDPQGANVFLDNLCRGVTPLTLTPVETGSHSLLLRLPGYNDYTSTITIAPGQVVQVQAGLTPVTTQAGPAMLLAPVALFLSLLILRRRG